MKKIILILSLVFLSASCNFFQQNLPVGVIKTVNGGLDWQFTNSAKNNPNASLAGLNISKMELDPGNREVVFAGAYNGGLYKSEDSGVSWVNIFPNRIYVYDFAIAPEDSKVIYTAGFYPESGRVAKTTDGGASWTEVYHEATSANPVRSIALNPLNSNQIIIGTASGTVIKSFDGGLTWQLVKDFKTQVNKVLWQNNKFYVLLKDKGLQVSGDLGQNFTNITSSIVSGEGFLGFGGGSEYVSTFSQVYVDGLDQNLMYLTTDLGLYKSTDGGKQWKKIQLPVKGSSSQARAISVYKNNSSTVFTSINATIYKSLDAGSTWQTQGINNAGGFVNYILIDPQLPQIVYGGLYSTQ